MTLPPPKSAQSYERHPLSAVWPDLEPTARQALRESMRQRGYDPLEPVVLYEGRVLDGWHRYSMARELGIEVGTVDYEGDDPAGLVIARHAGRRNLTPKERAHGVVRCRGWAPSGRPADDRKPSQDRGAGVPESRPAGRLSGKPSTNKELAAEADVSERTIRRAKAQVRAKDKKPEASVAGRLEANRAAVQAAATPPGDEIQARAVDAGPVAVSDAHRIRSKPDDEQRGGVAAVVDGDAARLRAGVEPEAPPSLPGEPASEDDGKRRPAGPPVRVEAGAMEAPDVSGRSDSGPDSSLHNESPVALERKASGPATLGWGRQSLRRIRRVVGPSRVPAQPTPRSSWHRPRRWQRRTVVPIRQPSGRWSRPRRRMRPGGRRRPTRRHRATAGRAAARRQQYRIGSWAAPMRRPTRRRCCRRGRRLPAGKRRMHTRKASTLQRPRKPLPTPMPSAGVACRHCELPRYVLEKSAGSVHPRASRLRAAWSRLWWRRCSGVWRQVWMSRRWLPACRRTWFAAWMRD